MLVTRKSNLTSVSHTLEIDITPEQLERVENRFHTKELIQSIIPDLSKEHREFLISGITPEEWNLAFSPVEEVD